MNATKQIHTPGPWKAAKYDRYGSFQVIQSENPVGHSICDNVRGLGDECEANARLIAAAPDLLAACKAVLAIPANEPGRVATLVPVLLAAVRKARGIAD